MKEFGPTGTFPDGKLDETDDGALKIGIAYDGQNNLIRIDFGKPIAWLAMDPAQAMQFAKTIIKRAGARKIEVTF
jgi:hypothetical protein